MSSLNISNDYLIKYRAISSKIKKRFLRKPNIAEASEEFGKLAKSLSDCEAWPQAGLCWLAVAKCEQSLSNRMTEVASMTEAAMNFLKAEQENHHLGCHTYDEHLITAISCFLISLNIYKEDGKPYLAASHAIELSQALRGLGKHTEALGYLQDASELLESSPIDHAICLDILASCKIDLGNLDGALNTYTQIILVIKQFEPENQTGALKDILAKCEICSLLLLLILKPLPKQLKEQHSKLLEKYASSSEIFLDVPYEDDEMVVLLQSLVLVCQTNDLDSFETLSEHLAKKLTSQQLDLFFILTKEMQRS